MTASLQLFARFRERAGAGSIEVPAGISVAELRVYLKSLWPELAHLVDASRFAIDNEFVGDDCPVEACGFPALIPPVSGG